MHNITSNNKLNKNGIDSTKTNRGTTKIQFHSRTFALFDTIILLQQESETED
jgi:hypothetical protein